MRLKSLVLVVICISLSMIHCANKGDTGSDRPYVGAGWKNDMHKLAMSMSQLLPLAVSTKEFHNKKNSTIIKRELKNIVRVSSKLSGHSPSDDPILKFTADRFSQEMQFALQQYKIGNTDFVQNSLRNSTNYCIGCHTRNNQGRQMDWKWGVDTKKLNPIDRAQYLAAIRDFDGALKNFDAILTSKDTASSNPRAWEISAKKSLAIAVRVKRDPELALKTVNHFLKSKSVPRSLQQTALQWRKSIKVWEKEQKKYMKKGKNWKARYLVESKNLLQRGWESTAFPQSGAGLVYFLRASSLLHDVLQESTKYPKYGEALYTAGLVAERLKDINLWTLHQAYYEACIGNSPRTKLAKKCYLRYEAVVLANYLNAPYGNEVPVHVRQHLNSLRKQAEMGDWNELLNWGLVE